MDIFAKGGELEVHDVPVANRLLPPLSRDRGSQITSSDLTLGTIRCGGSMGGAVGADVHSYLLPGPRAGVCVLQ